MDKRQGIVHIVGPEQGITQPGMTIVCGDSHTATHGAFEHLHLALEQVRLSMFCNTDFDPKTSKKYENKCKW